MGLTKIRRCGIVTARCAVGASVCLTSHSFNAVALSPPLVWWSLSRKAGSMGAFRTGSPYAVNRLAAHLRERAARLSC